MTEVRKMTESEFFEAAAAYKAAEAEMARLRKRRSELEEALKNEMGDREELWAGPFRVTWRRYVDRRLDAAALKAAQPELYAAYVRERPGRRFDVA